MTIRAVLVGAGALGRYHLLGLMATPGLTGIQVIEPNPDATAKARASAHDASIPVFFARDIGEAWPTSDLTIVATQAWGRAALVAELLERGHRTFLIEKLVCQSEAEYSLLVQAVRTVGARAWVNIPLRYNRFFVSAADEARGQPVVISAVGSDMGLSTNAIHFAALYLAFRRDWGLTYARTGLSPHLLRNKRGQSLVEFGGTLVGWDSVGNSVSLSNIPFQTPVQTITVTSESGWWFVDVIGTTAHFARRDENWRVHSAPYQESRVSSVTAIAAGEIVKHGTCLMPTLEELEGPHQALFRVFREHLTAVTGGAPECLPIT